MDLLNMDRGNSNYILGKETKMKKRKLEALRKAKYEKTAR